MRDTGLVTSGDTSTLADIVVDQLVMKYGGKSVPVTKLTLAYRNAEVEFDKAMHVYNGMSQAQIELLRIEAPHIENFIVRPKEENDYD